MKSVVFLLLVLGVVDMAFSIYMDVPLNPDDLRWIGKTCAFQSNPTPEHRQKWKKYDLSGADEKTMCFVKCVANFTNIYDPKAKKFNIGVVQAQFSGRRVGDPQGLSTLEGKVEGCAGVFTKLAGFMSKNMETYKRAFYAGDQGKADAIAWYKENNIKKVRGKKASVHCAERYPDAVKEACNITECHYHYYRLVDRSQKPVLDRDWSRPEYKINTDNLSACMTEAAKVPQSDECKVSVALKDCMEGKNKEEWKTFLELMDQISEDYKYPGDTSASTPP